MLKCIKGSNWYRVYSDGWKEQGGFVDYNKSISSTSSGYITFTYPKEFTQLNYTLQLTSNRGNCYAFETDGNEFNYTRRTLTGAEIGLRNVNYSETSTGNKRIAYFVCGY